MSKRLGVVMIVLFVLALSSVVSAAEQKESLAGNGGYIVEPAHETGFGVMSIQTITASITQGVTNWHYKTVSSFITTLNVDLNWGNPANSLQLTIYSPDGYIFGPYSDSYDGSLNGRINLNIINSNGIAQGTWRYAIYGARVTGTQYYSI